MPISSQDFVYTLEIVIPEEFPQVVKVESRLTVGSSASADVKGHNLSPNHCIFKVKDGILSVLNASGKKTTQLGKQALKHGKMYILDVGDRLRLEDVEILVGKEVLAAPEPEPQDKTAEFTRPRKERTKTRTSLDILKEQDEAPKEKKRKKVKANTRLKNLIGHTLEGPKPGILVRSMALLTEWAMAYALIYAIIPILGLEAVWQQIIDIVIVTIEPATAQIPPAMMGQLKAVPNSLYNFLIAWFLLQLTGNIFFGVPIPHAIMGMKTMGSFLISRVKAIPRSLLVFFDLLLIINIQVLFKKKTLKEYITFTEIYNGSTFIRRTGLFLFLPLIILIGILSPSLSHPDYLATIHKRSMVTTLPAKKIAKANEKYLPFNSRHFHLQVKNLLPPKTLVVPYSTQKKLWLIDPESKREVVLKKRGKRINLQIIVEKAAASDPLFHFHYPHLLTEGKWTITKAEDLVNFITALLNLDLTSLPTYILKHGPFISTHLVAKDMLMKALPETDTWESIPAKSATIFQMLKMKKGHQSRGFFPLTYPATQFYWVKSHKEAKKFGKGLTETIYHHSSWSKPKMPQKMDGISYLDHLYRVKTEIDPKLSKQFESYLKDLADEAEDSNIIVFQAASLSAIKNSVKYFGLKNQKKASKGLTRLLQELQMLEIKFKNDIDANKVQAAGLIK